MEKLARLFGLSIRFVYHCFDRIVIRGYLSTLSRPENIVYFFRSVKQVECISKETLRQRTDQYLSWVNAYTKNHEIPITWAEKDVRKKDNLADLRTRMQRQGRTGVYYVLKSMEQGPSFRIVKPKFPGNDPNWRIVAAQRARYTHLYFYIIDDVLGPFSVRIGAYLPFYATYYLNGHDIIAPMLSAQGVRFRTQENAFVSLADPGALQAAALLVIVRNRILRPIAGSLFDHPPKSTLKPNSTLQAQYRRTAKSFNDLVTLLKAA